MQTWQHGFWIYFFTRRHPQVWQFVIGSMIPDYVYLVMISVMVLQGEIRVTEILSIDPKVLMTFIPRYLWVTPLDLIGHSVVIWGIAFFCTLLPVAKKNQAIIIGWGSHLLFDAFTHGAYANYWLYPLSMHTVVSPVSFWEPGFYAREFRLVNNTLMIMMAFYLIYEKIKKKK